LPKSENTIWKLKNKMSFQLPILEKKKKYFYISIHDSNSGFFFQSLLHMQASQELDLAINAH